MDLPAQLQGCIGDATDPEEKFQVAALDFDAQGRIAVGSTDGSVRVMDVAGRNELRRFPPETRSEGAPPGDILALRWNTRGALRVVARNGTSRLLDPASNSVVSSRIDLGIDGKPGANAWEIQAAAIGPGGEKVAASDADEPRAAVVDPRPDGGPPGIVLSEGRITALAISPDEKSIASGTESGALFIKSGPDEPRKVRGPTGRAVTSLAWADLLAVADEGGGIEIRTSSGDAVVSAPASGTERSIKALAWRPSRPELAAACGDGKVRIFSIPTQNTDELLQSPPVELTAHRGAALALAWSPDGATLASGGNDHVVCLWKPDVPSGPFYRWAKPGPSLHSLALSSDGDVMAAGGADGKIYLWSAESRRLRYPPLDGHPVAVNALAWNPKSKVLVSGDEQGNILRWEWPDMKPVPLHAATSKPLTHHGESVSKLAWFPDGRRLASSGRDGAINIWTRETDTALTLARLPGMAQGLAIASDGRMLACACADGKIRVWKTSAGEIGKSTLDPDWVLPAADRKAGIGSLAISRDGLLLASAGNDGTVRSWDTHTGAAIGTLPVTDSYLESVTFGDEDHLLATMGADGQLRLFDGQNLQPLAAVPLHHGHGWSVAWVSAERSFVSASDDGTVQSVVWSEALWRKRVGEVAGGR
jgi:WD40 repeat protein